MTGHELEIIIYKQHPARPLETKRQTGAPSILGQADMRYDKTLAIAMV